MDIDIIIGPKGKHAKETEDLKHKSDEELHKMQLKLIKGCKKIFHKPGYMNV